ncbi:hypothetical protein [Gallaecimonas pentaromativorans]|uniref:Uncharacterized protein n=1 Tax=Gallaecimonas pentaromativorans TaxID=584787 RepID=A0A3N1PV62_9GAMM|nr:hypothetical protein [Gallaecimonas pentaromativorans]ROQ30640.1 hypothetical protein EDC28_101326 [Gallaecimonas pentaromativorans]
MSSVKNISIVTDKEIIPFSRDFSNYLFPVDQIKKYCIKIDSEVLNQGMDKGLPATLLNKNPNRFAGPLSSNATKPVGAQKKQAALESLDRGFAHGMAVSAERAAWKGKPVYPQGVSKAMAPIQPVSGINSRNIGRASGAYLLGLLIQEGSEIALFRGVRDLVESLDLKIKDSDKGMKSALVIVRLDYLRISTDYGRAPKIIGAYLEEKLDPDDYFSAVKK